MLLRPSGVRPQFQRSSPLKPLSQSQTLYEASIGSGNQYVYIPGHITKLANMPIYGKNLQRSFFLEPVDRFQRNLA